MPSQLHRCLVRCTVGLEPLVQRELNALQVGRGAERDRGGVLCQDVSLRSIMRANAFLRCADRVLVEACRFHATSFGELELAVKRLRPLLEPWLPADSDGGRPDLAIKVRSRGSKLYEETSIAKRMLRSLGGSYPAASSRAAPRREPHLVVHVLHNEFTVYADSSGAPLHERGWRLEAAKMPLRSSLAAALLLRSGWADAGAAGAAEEAPSSYVPLVDPFCGAGTIPIEAACMASGRPPHVGEGGAALRGFALERWPLLDAATWSSVQAEVAERAHAAGLRHGAIPPIPPIIGADRDAGAVAASARNAMRAGVDGLVEFRHEPISALRPPPAASPAASPAALAEAPGERGPPGRGLLLTNPPWGVRSAGRGSSEDTRNLYAKLGSVAAQRCGGWRLAMLVAEKAHARQASRALKSKLELTIGGKRTWLMAAGAPALPVAVPLTNRLSPHPQSH